MFGPHGSTSGGVVSAEVPGEISPIGYWVVRSDRATYLVWPTAIAVNYSEWNGTRWGPRQSLIEFEDSGDLSNYETILGDRRVSVQVAFGRRLHTYTLDRCNCSG